MFVHLLLGNTNSTDSQLQIVKMFFRSLKKRWLALIVLKNEDWKRYTQCMTLFPNCKHRLGLISRHIQIAFIIGPTVVKCAPSFRGLKGSTANVSVPDTTGDCQRACWKLLLHEGDPRNFKEVVILKECCTSQMNEKCHKLKCYLSMPLSLPTIIVQLAHK